jgi:acyl-CoA reductase-like NAD-dependent aldehyde dehydrogenase
VSSWIDKAAAGGAQLLGGGRRSETTLVPAIVVQPAADAKVSQLEIFGPVTCVYSFETLDAWNASQVGRLQSLEPTVAMSRGHLRSTLAVR